MAVDLLGAVREAYVSVESRGMSPRFLLVPVLDYQGNASPWAPEFVRLARAMQNKSKLILPRGVEQNRNIGLDTMHPVPGTIALQVRFHIGEELVVAV